MINIAYLEKNKISDEGYQLLEQLRIDPLAILIK